MNEAFIPPAPATPDLQITVPGFGTGTVAEIEHHIAQLIADRDAARDQRASALAERDDARQPINALFAALEPLIEQMIEEQLSSSIDSHVEAALENASVEVEAYIRL